MTTLQQKHAGTVQPPQLSVPVAVDAEAASRAADDAGSADGALSVALLAAARGETVEAMDALRRADARGSAAAAYQLGMVLATQKQGNEALAAWQRADARGSASAAFTLASIAGQRGTPDQAQAAWQRALELATAGDAAGRADDACVLAQLLVRNGDLAGSQAAWEHADALGAGMGSLAVAHLALQRGDLDRAQEALTRADDRGIAAGAFNRGLMLFDRGDHDDARAAWRRAAQFARRQGDTTTYAAAMRALRPSGRLWLQLHLGLVVTLALVLALLAIVVDWHASAAALIAACALYMWRRPVYPGTPINTTDTSAAAGAPTVGAGPLTLFGDVGPDSDALVRSRSRTTRPATVRDMRYLLIRPLALTAAAVVLALWAAGAIGGETVVRAGSAMLGVLMLWSVAWLAPQTIRGPLAAPATDTEDDDKAGDTVHGGASFSPAPTLAVGVKGSISDPRLVELTRWIRSRRLANARHGAWLRRTRQIAGQLGVALAGVVAIALAVAPDRGAVLDNVASIGGTIVELVTVAAGVGLALAAAVRAARSHDARAVAASAAYLLLVAALIAAAAALGLLDAWGAILDAIGLG
jgi:tetratricopeptide (TPR) repeat protein